MLVDEPAPPARPPPCGGRPVLPHAGRHARAARRRRSCCRAPTATARSASSASRSAAASRWRRTREEAEHASMPRAAIATGMVDWVLPVAEMPAAAARYFELEKQLKLPPEDGPPPAPTPRTPATSEAALREVLAFLRSRTGRDFTCYKRATVVRRIAPAHAGQRRARTCPAYLDCLRTRPGEAGALLQDLLISVTNFFRDARLLRGAGCAAGRAVQGQGAERHRARLGAGLRHRRGGVFAGHPAGRTSARSSKRRR